MVYSCDNCGLEEAESICSASGTLICTGNQFGGTGCGAILTPYERHYCGTSCEACEQNWSDMMERYRKGEDNPDLGKLFDAPVTSN